ncbi:peroxiredoxin [Longispora albida]|uniref:peroxiredoxin n=1 Tax=Longispora albida TaxID=203523 RepID=UPI00035F02EF|nr:peroxiredoxin [Longispora albida]
MKPGDLAPDFELPDQQGQLRKLSTLLADGPVVLFFYPAAMTAGCTAESCHFRDLAAEFAEAGAQRVGISPDTVDKQKQFSDMHAFDYPLLADEGGAVAAQFGVKRGIGLLPVKRHTFVIGKDRRIVEIIKSELRMSVHADKALEALRAI